LAQVARVLTTHQGVTAESRFGAAARPPGCEAIDLEAAGMRRLDKLFRNRS